MLLKKDEQKARIKFQRKENGCTGNARFSEKGYTGGEGGEKFPKFPPSFRGIKGCAFVEADASKDSSNVEKPENLFRG